MSNEKIKVLIQSIIPKDLDEQNKIIENSEVISMFVEKHGIRYKIRIRLNEILSTYLSKIEVILPLSAQKGLGRKLKEVLGYSLLYFFIYILISIVHILIF
jgi:hypothetical protein